MSGFENARAKLWSAVFADTLEPKLVAKAFVNGDITQTSEILQYGDTVHVNTLGPVNVFDYTENTEMSTLQILESADATLAIDKKKAFNFFVDDIDEKQVRPEIMEKAMENSAVAVAKKIDTDIFTCIKGAVPEGNTIGYAVPIQVTANNIYDNIIKLKVILDENNVPDEGRKLAVRPEVEGLLLNDNRFVAAGVPQSEQRLETGLVLRALGFDIYKSNNVPAGKIIASVPLATTHVHQLSKFSTYEPENLFGTACKGLNVYGTKTFYPAATAMINYTLDEYDLVESPSGNPASKGYYEIDTNHEFVLTEDTSVTANKDYYEKK